MKERVICMLISDSNGFNCRLSSDYKLLCKSNKCYHLRPHEHNTACDLECDGVFKCVSVEFIKEDEMTL